MTAAKKKADVSVSSALDFSVDKNIMLKALEHLIGVVEQRNTIPILSHILITAGQGSIALKSSDLDMEASETVEANVSKQGSLTVNAETLFAVVKRARAGQVLRFESFDGSRLKATSGRATAELFVLPAIDFPDIGGEAVFTHSFDVGADVLARLLTKPQFAISTESTRYYLCGIYLHVSGGKLRAVATDGHKLARIDAECPAGAVGIPGVIIPSKVTKELVKLLGSAGDAFVHVEMSDTKMRVTVGACTILSKLIDGSFPDYARVIPENKACRAVAPADELSEAVSRVEPLITGRKGIGIEFKEDEARVFAREGEGGGAATDFVGIDYSGEPVEIGFNPKYLSSILNLIDGENVEIKLADGSSPAVFLDSGDADCLYLCMPMRI